MVHFLRKIRRIFARGLNQVSIVKVVALLVILNFLFGALFYFVERDIQEGLTFSDAIWWAMVTMTTVGYGDFYAQTNLGRYLISYPCMLVGIGIIGYLISALAESMVERIGRYRRGFMAIKTKNHT